jgi:RNA polymerase sigma-70 factor (ECF subfamily)
MDKINQLYHEWQSKKRSLSQENYRDRLLREIWQVYHPKLQVFLSSDPSCPRGDREDRASEILLRVFESLENYNPDYAFSTWIYRIARNSQIDRFRKKGPLFVDREPQESDGRGQRDGWETPESIVIGETEKSLIKSAIETLPPTQRELLFLAYYENMKYAEISQVTGLPVGTIKYNIHMIKKDLKSLLKEDW